MKLHNSVTNATYSNQRESDNPIGDNKVWQPLKKCKFKFSAKPCSAESFINVKIEIIPALQNI